MCCAPAQLLDLSAMFWEQQAFAGDAETDPEHCGEGRIVPAVGRFRPFLQRHGICGTMSCGTGELMRRSVTDRTQTRDLPEETC